MEKKVYNVEIIGIGLTLLYATSCLVFLQYLKIPGFEQYTILYGVLFCISIFFALSFTTYRILYLPLLILNPSLSVNFCTPIGRGLLLIV